MTQTGKIILPLDGSDASLEALVPAKSLAELLGWILHIVHVSEEKLAPNELMKKLHLDPAHLPEFVLVHKKGDPVNAIINEASSPGIIVMCMIRQEQLTGEISNVITSGVLEKSEAPVLLMRPGIPIPVENNKWIPKKVLVPLDGAPDSVQAIDASEDIIKRSRAHVDVLHIFGNHESPQSGAITAPFYEDYQQQEWESWSVEFLKRFCTCFHDYPYIDLSLSRGDAANEIISFSMRHHNDLIVLGWHGKLFPSHAMVMKKIIRDVSCPVFLKRILPGNDEVSR